MNYLRSLLCIKRNKPLDEPNLNDSLIKDDSQKIDIIIDESGNEPVESPVKESMGEFVDVRLSQSVDESVVESFNQSVDESVDESVVESLEQSVVESLEQSVVESLEQSVVESLEQSVIESLEQSVIESLEQSSDEHCNSDDNMNSIFTSVDSEIESLDNKWDENKQNDIQNLLDETDSISSDIDEVLSVD